jgi:YidC/Oxa1 family membrane protein insertase
MSSVSQRGSGFSMMKTIVSLVCLFFFSYAHAAELNTKQLQPDNSSNISNLEIKTPNALFVFTAVGGCLGQNALTNTKTSYNDPQNVSVVANDKLCKAFGLRIDNEDLRTKPAKIWQSSDKSVHVTQQGQQFEVEKVFSLGEENDGLHNFSLIIRNISKNYLDTTADLEIGATSDLRNAGGVFSNTPAEFHSVGVRLPDGKIKREKTPFESSPALKTVLSESNISPNWITADSLYWMNTLIPQFTHTIDFQVVSTGYNIKKNADAPVNQTVYDAFVKHPVRLAPGQSVQYDYKVYFGPKSETFLKKFSTYHLNETIDYGFFKIVARPLYYVLAFLHALVKNWGIAIIVLTLLINVIFLPLQLKAYISAQRMQAFQPELKALQEKYKDDKPTLQKESMALMSKHGVNPLSGCLPLLPQIPVFFGLDSALRHTFALRQAPFFGWIHDLTLHDPYFVLPVLMAILMLGYQKMIPMPSMDPTQAKIMKFLPIIFSFFMVFYPSGLALYVITNTLVSMIRQYVFMRRVKIPQLQLQT